MLFTRLFDFIEFNFGNSKCVSMRNYSVSCTHEWADSKSSLACIKALNKQFQTFVQNRVVEIRKIILPEDWSYCSTKVNPSDSITRLDKSIDLS